MSNDRAREVQKTASEGTTGAISDFVRETTKPGVTSNFNASPGADTRTAAAPKELDFTLNDPLSPNKIGNDFGSKTGGARVAEATTSELAAERTNKAIAGFIRETPLTDVARHNTELRDAFAENRLPKLSEQAKSADDATIALNHLGKDTASKADLQGLLAGKLKADPKDPLVSAAILNDRDSVKRLIDGFDTKPVANLKDGNVITRDKVKEEGSDIERADNAKYSVRRALRENNPERAVNDASLKELIRTRFDKQGTDGVADALATLEKDMHLSDRRFDVDGNRNGGMTLRILDVPKNQPSPAEVKSGGYRYDENHSAFVRTLAVKQFDLNFMGR